MSDLGEPWRIEDGLMVMRTGYIIGEGEHIDRIAACVNACAGIPSDQLEEARRLLLSAGFNMTAAERQEYLKRKSAEFREMAGKRTGVSIENDPRSVPPEHRTPLGVAIEASRPVPGTDLHEVRVQLPGAKQLTPPLNWRKDPPMSARPVGYDLYWVLAPNGARFVVKVQAMALREGVLIYRFGETIPRKIYAYAGYQWAGPIEPPTLPET